MTSTPRTYADPREVVARAIGSVQDFEDYAIRSVMRPEDIKAVSDAAIAALARHGFLSDLCFTAMKAHK